MKAKDRLKSLRRAAGYVSMPEFCNAAGISFNTYQNYESGKRIPTTEMLIKIADFYGVTIDYLLGRDQGQTDDTPLDEFAQRECLKNPEKIFLQKYLELTDDQRDSVLNFFHKVAEGLHEET